MCFLAYPRRLSGLIFVLMFVAVASNLRAQDSTVSVNDANAEPVNTQTASRSSNTCSPSAQPQKRGSKLELQTAMLYLRYRFVENSARVTTINQAQHSIQSLRQI